MNNKKKIIIASVVAIFLFLIGFGTGKYMTPAKTVVQEKLHVETVEKQVVVTQTKTEVKVVYLKDTSKDAHIETTTEKKADGTIVVKKVEDDHVKTEVKNDTDKNVIANKSMTDDKSQVIDQSKTIMTIRDTKPNWSLALMPGIDFAGIYGKQTYNLMPDVYHLTHVVVGVSLERRILGPIYMGMWGNTQGTGGLTLRINF